MAVKPENNFIQKVHKRLPPSVYRMKTHNPYVAGVPDCYYSGTKDALWVEYKFVPRLPARVPLDINLSALQRAWLVGRHNEGRNVAVIVGSPEGAVILRVTDLPDALTTEQFRKDMLTIEEVALWLTNQTTER